MTWAWLATFPTTNGRIALSLAMAAATTIRYLASTAWVPSLEWLGFLCIWAGLDVAQYAGKRLTHTEYAVTKERAKFEAMKEPQP
jgi:hypothetical protein